MLQQVLHGFDAFLVDEVVLSTNFQILIDDRRQFAAQSAHERVDALRMIEVGGHIQGAL